MLLILLEQLLLASVILQEVMLVMELEAVYSTFAETTKFFLELKNAKKEEWDAMTLTT